PACREALLGAARSVGDRLESLAVRDARIPGVSWIGLSILGDHWALVPLGPAAGEPRFTALAAEALDSARRQLAGGAADLPVTGAFIGWGGVIYTLVHLAALWDNPALLAEAEALATGPLTALLDSDPAWDLMAGTSG